MRELPDLNIEEIIALLNAKILQQKSLPPQIPAPLILTGANLKSGLSARDVAKQIIVRQSEAGAPIGNLPDGSESVSEKMEIIRAQTLLEHLITNAKITIVIPPGVPITSVGSNAAGPVLSQGVTTAPAIGYGIIQ